MREQPDGASHNPSRVHSGLRAHNLEDFGSKVKEYGSFPSEYVEQIYGSVTAKLNTASGIGEAFERAAPEAETAPKTEEEPKWGLNVRHVYNPTAPKGKSLLGAHSRRATQ